MQRLPEEVEEYFPYRSIRPYQDEFIHALHATIKERKHAVIEGSNGLGKTISALSACLPTVKNNDMQLIYLAKTHRQHDRVIEELKAISKRQKVSGVSLRGRSEMCFHPFITRHAADAKSAMEICELLKKRHQCPYHTNIEEKTEASIDLQLHLASNAFTATEIQEICRKEKFCPYEITKLILSQVDVIALSYLYLFDPPVRTVFLKQLERPLSKLILVIDEAHNLPDTAIDIASDSLSLFSIRQAEQEAKQFSYRDITAFTSKLRLIVEKMTSKTEKETLVEPKLFCEMIERETEIGDLTSFVDHLHNCGNTIRRRMLSEGKFPQSYVHRMGEFFARWVKTTEDEAYVHTLSKYFTHRGTRSARLEIVALDPSKITKPIFSAVYSSIVMSGTLEPLDSFAKITDMPKETVQKAIPSPFPREHILTLICCGVTTAMEQRNPGMYKKIVERIIEVTESTPANVGIFAASYDVLEALLNIGIEDAINKPLFHEERGMKSKENELLINRFKSYAKKGGAVLLGVQGGRSSEGTDYPGDQMNSVAIVGVPYAEPTPKVKAQIDYYEKRFPKLGREYGYVLPALKKAAQAAGRPIRTLEDRGALVFLDHRYATSYCQKFLPLWIRRDMKTLPNENGLISQELRMFFGTRV
ncbi:MAG: helicase C-terminal domain-containing protein [Candidatus Bathyarchaeia archaeon]|jgi:DNA excision repair protein ERCC-2|nr:DEAD/DEAH box helicase family protein [Candidatus Bathyarchaeota archaeon A05DMB-4]MDH7595236.1 helicase C-terminal domain-containing protein [Candidatus Bathyarchaeota archaeon]